MQEVERQRDRLVIGDAVVQAVEVGHAIGMEMHDLGVDDERGAQARGLGDYAGVSPRPVVAVHRVQADPPVADVYLEAVAVVLQLVPPASPRRGMVGDHGLARVNEGGGRAVRPAARATRHHACTYRCAENQCQSQNVREPRVVDSVVIGTEALFPFPPPRVRTTFMDC